MESPRPRNDLSAALVKLCVAIEEHRRTPDGRVRTSQQFLAHFFSVEGSPSPMDRVFVHMPKEVRGPILSSWGIRGAKAALRDDDAKVASVVVDALAAGDLDADAFETALEPSILLAWVPLASFWSFWRAGTINRPSLLRAFTSAYELRLLDARSFFEGLRARGGELTSTDVLGHAFTKDDLIEWMRRVHASGDGSPKGLLEAVGWEKIVQKAPTEALLGALDALAVRLGLAEASAVALAEKADSEDESEKAPDSDVETSENSAPKTDPPQRINDDSWSPPADLAKTGPYATPLAARKKDEVEADDDDSDETRLYRQRPIQRRS